MENKKEFVKKLGQLLSQTRLEIEGCEFDDKREVVVIRFINGHTKEVNVACNSCIAIMLDVSKCLCY